MFLQTEEEGSKGGWGEADSSLLLMAAQPLALCSHTSGKAPDDTWILSDIVSGSPPDLLNQKLWRWGPEISVLTSPVMTLRHRKG